MEIYADYAATTPVKPEISRCDDDDLQFALW